MPSRLRLPRLPQAPAPFRFPIIASTAPVVIAVVIWLVTGSAFALLFAALGPVAAIAGWVDARWTARRTRANEHARFARDAEEALQEIGRRHNRERAQLDELAPSARALAIRRAPDPYRWRTEPDSGVPVCVGTGARVSSLECEALPESTDPAIQTRLEEIVETAHLLQDAPIVLNAELGIGVSGPRAVTRSVARALAVQAAWRLSPQEYWWSANGPDDREWMRELPHRERRGAASGEAIVFGRVDDDEPRVTLAIASSPELLPRVCRVVVDLGLSPAEIVQHPDVGLRVPLQPGVLTRQHALEWARYVNSEAEREGAWGARGRLPDSVNLDTLQQQPRAGRHSLSCTIAVGVAGPVAVDLVADGPHAIVGGTTGSGKSELLVSWVLAMATERAPSEVTFLLVDFKGGAAFAPLQPLPHTVGIVTDLDTSGVTRALESLRAELHFRERLLLSEGVRSIEETNAAPRLVIVVDEYAAMVAEHPDLHPLFSDLAARGRSLGIHLILCTQRPAGVVRDGVLANIDLRVSLRVNNRGDSAAVVGTEDAAAIPATARGRAVLRTAGYAHLVQFARAHPQDIARVAARWAGSPPARHPWCAPLPLSLEREELPTGVAAEGVPFALEDLPREQRQTTALYTPRLDGHLLVLGGPRTGKSNLLDVIAQSSPGAIHLPSSIDAAWDVLHDVVEPVRAQSPAGPETTPADRLVIIDDLDSLVARFAGEYRQAFVEALNSLLRDGPARGIHAVIAAQRLISDISGLASLAPSRLMLRHASRQDFVVAGGDGSQFAESLPPGGGHWRGNRIQVARAAPYTRPIAGARVGELTPGRALAVVSSQSHLLLRRSPSAVALADVATDLAAAAAAGVTIVGDVDEWQSRWGALASLRSRAEIVFDRCSTADFRALTRSRTLPPPLAAGQCWRVADDGSVSRTRVPW